MLALVVNYLRLLILEIWSLCQEMAPFLLLGMAISGLISIFIDSRFILRHLGSKNFFSIVKSTVFGIPLPLCSCGVIPVAATLREAGASKGSTVSFLVSTPQTGVDSIFLTYGMLGPVFALFRPLAAFISGIFTGLVINSFDDDAHYHRRPEIKKESNVNKPLVKRLESGVTYGFLSLPSDIVVPLFQGIIIAAGIAIFLPADFIAENFSSNSYVMLFMMLFVSLPIYVCATASIPIALVLMTKGLSAGAVFVFLMAGPTTNASSIVVIKNILGRKTMYHFLLLTASTAILFGFILDIFIIIDPLAISGTSHVHTTDGWGTIMLTTLFLIILLNAYAYKLKGEVVETGKGENDFDTSKDHLSIGVDGMTCSHCKESVESAVYSCGGVENAIINLKTGEVMVSGSRLNETEIREEIKRKGFSLN